MSEPPVSGRVAAAPTRDQLSELCGIPGVGVRIAEDLWRLGVRSLADLRGRDPQELYERMRDPTGAPADHCLLYVFRRAVYYVSNDRHDPELLNWWNWKDR